MDPALLEARDHFIQGMSRISSFWGFPRAMGAIYGALYLSPTSLSLDELSEQVNVTKGAVSTNVRNLERLGMVHKEIRLGERKDYYHAEIDFWKIIKNILQEREKSAFDHALRTVSESLEAVRVLKPADAGEAELAAFYQERMREMQRFFNSLDNLVATLLALEEFRLGAVESLLGGKNRRKSQPGDPK